MSDTKQPEDQPDDTTAPKGTEPDALDAVSTAARIWTKAKAAWPERNDLDRAIVRAFDAGRTGTDVAPPPAWIWPTSIGFTGRPIGSRLTPNWTPGWP